MEALYSIEQIAEILHMHPKTIRKYICEGKLRASKLGRNWRVSGHDLSVFVEERKMVPGTETDCGDKNTGIGGEAVSKITVSAVIDMPVSDIDHYSRVSNLLLAAMNSRRSELYECVLNVQHIPSEKKLRAMLFGTPEFAESLIGCLKVFSPNTESVCDEEISI